MASLILIHSIVATLCIPVGIYTVMVEGAAQTKTTMRLIYFWFLGFVGLTSFGITGIVPDGYSIVHAFSAAMILSVIGCVLAARRANAKAYKICLYIGFGIVMLATFLQVLMFFGVQLI